MEQGITLPTPSMTAPAPLPAAMARPQELLTGTSEEHQFHLPTNAAGAAKTARRPRTILPNQPTTVLPSFSLSACPFPLVQCYSRQNQQQHMFPNPKVYQQPNHRYRHPPCPTEESGCKKSLKATFKEKDTTGRMALPASSVGKNGWLITIDSTMETGGVEKNRTKSLKNGWKT